MAAIAIRNLDEAVKQRLRVRAAAHRRSMEAEARAILTDALRRPARADLSWIAEIIEVADDVGGVELDLPQDEEAAAAPLLISPPRADSVP